MRKDLPSIFQGHHKYDLCSVRDRSGLILKIVDRRQCRHLQAIAVKIHLSLRMSDTELVYITIICISKIMCRQAGWCFGVEFLNWDGLEVASAIHSVREL